ncbi:MAG: NAD(P)/FAD-dependent oxidoreductase [Deferrisomatales bacterium]
MATVTAWDAVVVGAGAAGIFAARELAGRGARVLLLERGADLARRRCPRRETQGPCRRCVDCRLLSGWGGAGAYSDGKLSLSARVGGFLADYIPLPELGELLSFVDGVYRQHGAPEAVHGRDVAEMAELGERARAAGLTLVENPVRHMGTEVCQEVLASLYREVSRRVEVRFESPCERVEVASGRVRGVWSRGEFLPARAVILAPGRLGAPWTRELAAALGIPTRPNPVDIGVRVECPAEVLQEVTDVLYEAKLYYLTPTFGDEVRTFCMNPRGEVVHEVYEDCLTVNGHSYARARSPATNFALLVKTDFTEPFDDPIAYGKSIARLANLLAGGVLVQRFADLVDGRRSTPARIAKGAVAPTLHDATPGDLAFALPHRHMTDLTETLYALDAFCPGVAGPDTLLYGAEVKFYSNRLALDGSLQTPVEGLYGAGDGVGVSRGLMQASASGVWAARAVARREAEGP